MVFEKYVFFLSEISPISILNFKGSVRDCSYKYFFNIEKESFAMCKKFVIGTFDIIGKLYRAFKTKEKTLMEKWNELAEGVMRN